MTEVRAAFVAAPELIEFRNVAVPSPTGDVALVEIIRCGVCGSDLAGWKSGTVRPPVFGHEWVGRVTALGPDADGIAVADRVVMAVPPPCGECAMCESGLSDDCDFVWDVACGRHETSNPHGGFTTTVPVVASRLIQVPASMSDDAAAMVEPTAVVVHGLLRAQPVIGAYVVVQGAGPIGLLAAMCAKAMGAAHIIVIEPGQDRRDLALRVGAHKAVSPGPDVAAAVSAATNGRGADLVIECTGAAALLQPATDLARRSGTLLQLGYPKYESTIHAGDWMRRQLRFICAMTYVRSDFEYAIRMIEQGLDVLALHTGTAGLSELDGALSALAAQNEGHVKILIDPHR